ncbi:MAG: type II toxin-antitoxin system Phd/YefM family antitoxin [Acidobacteria bacterium]|jgi:prevent-host-death family protein|nr:type II toxin-antitoxin system Phd/YefM family antitoxin [Acidobacteriota bacterium]
MATTVNIHEAKTHLSRLLERVVAGELVIIAKAGKPVARLTRYGPKPRQPRLGAARGKLWISPNFDAPLPKAILDEFEK